jgi:tRNA threonylcarbamoyladenosine biosynthesis protein TsaE
LNRWRLPEAEDTERLGAALARTLQDPIRTPLVVYLQGELGSGKTTLARGLLRALGVADSVRSPTYSILECYETRDRRAVHVDLYRLSESAELAPLGLRDELAGGVLMLIEWPDRFAPALPPPDLRILLAVEPLGRIAELQACTPAGRIWLEAARAILNAESNGV